MLAPDAVKRYPIFNSAFAAFDDWVHKRKLYRECRQRLEACDSDEIARIAHDVGLSPNELRHMAKLGPDAAKLLLARIAALHLDADVLAESEPATMRDMQRLCSECVSKKRCQRDLSQNPDDPVWRRYCPNAGTLALLQNEGAAAHKP